MKNFSMRETNEKLVQILQERDPFSIGKEGYDTEIANVAVAVHDEDNPGTLAKQIKKSISSHSKSGFRWRSD